MKIDLREIMRRFHKLNIIRTIYAKRITSASGLYLGQPAVLQYVIEHDGCTQKEIADEMQITPASIAISTKRMQKAGLIERITDENNMRCNKLFITQKGLRASEECRKKFTSLDKQMFSGFDEKELHQLCSYLDKIINNITSDEFEGKTVFSLIEMGDEIDKKENNLKEGKHYD